MPSPKDPKITLHGFPGRILVAENKNTLLRSHHPFGRSSSNNSFQLKRNPKRKGVIITRCKKTKYRRTSRVCVCLRVINKYCKRLQPSRKQKYSTCSWQF